MYSWLLVFYLFFPASLSLNTCLCWFYSCATTFIPISSPTCCTCCVYGNSEISLLKLTCGQCASTAMSACLRSSSAAWPDVSVMPKSARKNLLSVCSVSILYNLPLHPLIGSISAFFIFCVVPCLLTTLYSMACHHFF